MTGPIFYNIYKPKDLTSARVLSKLKRHLGKSFKKIGHLGTLDPFAEGVLIAGANGACRLNDLFSEYSPKEYVATGVLGVATETGDFTGKITQVDEEGVREKLKELDRNTLLNMCQNRFQNYMQEIPHFSAAKFNGRPLYELAREGILVTKDPVGREILDLDIIEIHENQITFKVLVSRGTYIRKFFEDIANMLGMFGHLSSLKRTAVGKLNITDSIDMDKVLNGEQELKCFSACDVLPLEELIIEDPKQLKLISNGNPIQRKNLEQDAFSIGQNLWIKGPDRNLICLGQVGEFEIGPKVVF